MKLNLEPGWRSTRNAKLHDDYVQLRVFGYVLILNDRSDLHVSVRAC